MAYRKNYTIMIGSESVKLVSTGGNTIKRCDKCRVSLYSFQLCVRVKGGRYYGNYHYHISCFANMSVGLDRERLGRKLKCLPTKVLLE